MPLKGLPSRCQAAGCATAASSRDSQTQPRSAAYAKTLSSSFALAKPQLILHTVDKPSGFPEGFDQGAGDMLVGEDDEAAVTGHYRPGALRCSRSYCAARTSASFRSASISALWSW